jgi:hypothetical protein
MEPLPGRELKAPNARMGLVAPYYVAVGVRPYLLRTTTDGVRSGASLDSLDMVRANREGMLPSGDGQRGIT